MVSNTAVKKINLKTQRKIEQLLRQALRLQQSGQFEKAVDSYNKILKWDPTHKDSL